MKYINPKCGKCGKEIKKTAYSFKDYFLHEKCLPK